MKEDAEKEEQKRKLHEESVMIFLDKNSGEFEQLKREINEPNQH